MTTGGKAETLRIKQKTDSVHTYSSAIATGGKAGIFRIKQYSETVNSSATGRKAENT
jgi:hypothetical protein